MTLLAKAPRCVNVSSEVLFLNHRSYEKIQKSDVRISRCLPAVAGSALECGGAPPLFRSVLKSKIIVSRCSSHHSYPMPKPATPWPHAPKHQLSENGAYFVTAGTYLKAHHFRTPQRLEVLERGLLTVTRDFSWELEAWAVFSNHYHFVAHSRSDSKNASSLSQMLGILHTRTAGWINQLDKTPGRKVWHNFWDTRLTYQKSYLARLNCSSKCRKAWAGADSKPVSVVFGQMV